jgi:hypothetical protein
MYQREKDHKIPKGQCVSARKNIIAKCFSAMLRILDNDPNIAVEIPELDNDVGIISVRMFNPDFYEFASGRRAPLAVTLDGSPISTTRANAKTMRD